MVAKTYLRSGKVEVRYVASHTNHHLNIQECKYLPLPPSVKDDIQQQFATGKPIEQIMDSKMAFMFCTKHSLCTLQSLQTLELVWAVGNTVTNFLKLPQENTLLHGKTAGTRCIGDVRNKHLYAT